MYRTADELKAGLSRILQSPRDRGVVQAIVVRPASDQRTELTECRFEVGEGAAGDRWVSRFPSPPLPGDADQESQITIMNARAVDWMARSRDRWALAGDQLYVDLDLSDDNLKAGDRLTVGEAVLEVTPMAHNGCRKFSERFGPAALAFVNSPEGKRHHLRGIYARVVRAGTIRVGDVIGVEKVVSAVA